MEIELMPATVDETEVLTIVVSLFFIGGIMWLCSWLIKKMFEK